MKDFGFQYIGISIDSIEPEIHDSFRGVKGAFNDAVKGIENILSEGIPVGIRTTIMKSNINEVEDLVHFAKDLGVSRVVFYILDTIGRGRELVSELPSKKQLRSFADKLIEISREFKGKLEILVVRANFIGIYLANRLSNNRNDFMNYLRLLGSQGDCGRKTVSIYPDGTVRPCQFLDYVIIGDLRKEKLRKILNPKNQKLKPFLSTYNFLRGERCRNCPFKKTCGGGSRNRALVVFNDFWGDDPLCFVNYKEIALKWGIKENVHSSTY